MEEAPLDQSLIDQVLAQASTLGDLDDAARAEAWASGVLGLWREPGAEVDPVAADRQLAEALVVDGSVQALSLAVALAAVAPAESNEAIQAAVAALEGEGVEPPTWAAAVGTAQPGRAWAIDDAERGRRTAIVEFVATDGAHTMLVELDQGCLSDVTFGPAADDLFAGLSEPGADQLDPVETSAEILGEEIRAGWQAALNAGHEPSESWIVNRSLALRRLELFGSVAQLEARSWVEHVVHDEETDSHDLEADAAARSVLTAALGDLSGDDPDSIGAAAEQLRGRIAVGEWPAAAVAAGGALQTGLSDREFLLNAASAYASRRPLPMPPDEVAAVRALEWADWLGSVIGLVRAGAGAQVTATGLVDNVNRCPEVSTSIPGRDREYFERAFELVLEAWRFCEFIEAGDRLTELGLWAIPRGLDRAWSS